MLQTNKFIYEIKIGNNFGYILENDKFFLDIDYKVLKNQNNSMFIPCVKMKFNGKSELYYLADEYRTLSSIINEIKTDSLIYIMVNIFFNVIAIKNNGFLQCQNIDISLDKIYIAPKTMNVRLVYVPVSAGMFSSYIEFEHQLRTNMIKCLNNKRFSNDAIVREFVMDLANVNIKIKQIYEKYKTILEQYINNNIMSMQNAINRSCLKLVAMDTPGYFEVVLDKPKIVFGKKQFLVDIVIPFNKLISRKHCSIFNNNGNYYIVDECSANGTFVNGRRIPPNQSIAITKGDIVRMANSNFQLV